MRYSYQTTKICPKTIEFDLDGNIVSNVAFLHGGCPGNLQAVPRLVEGMTVEELTQKLSGINCGFKGTSCANELATCVKDAYEKSKVKA